MPRNCPRPEAGLSAGPQSGVAPAPLCSRRAPRLPARHACGSCRPQLSPGGRRSCPQVTVSRSLLRASTHARGPAAWPSAAERQAVSGLPCAWRPCCTHGPRPPKPAPHRGLGSVGRPWDPTQAPLASWELSFHVGGGPLRVARADTGGHGTGRPAGRHARSRLGRPFWSRVLAGTGPRDAPGRAP